MIILFLIFHGLLLMFIGISVVFTVCKIEAYTNEGELIMKLHKQNYNKKEKE